MKIISILFLLWFTLVSCTNNKTVENNKITVDNKKIENKVVENNKETTKNNLNNNKEKMTEKTIVSAWDNIAVTYTWRLEDWTIFDATSKHWWEPLKFEVWAGKMIKWFDNWVIWMELGETKKIEIQPADAYWEYNPKLQQVLQKKDLTSFTNAWIKLEKWAILPTQYGNFKIISTDDKTVTIDTNHELAWKKLIFDVKVVEIK